jgi:hypothetical protein
MSEDELYAWWVAARGAEGDTTPADLLKLAELYRRGKAALEPSVNDQCLTVSNSAKNDSEINKSRKSF